jgi:hypothetical protein
MIVSGQMTREEAVRKLSEPLYDENLKEQEIGFVLDKLEMTREEFDRIMKEPPRQHSEFRTSFVNKMTGKILEIRKKRLGY